VARRADGFHELETVMSTVNLFDTLDLGKRDDGRIEFQWQPALARTGIRLLNPALMPTDDRNLVVRAALLLKNYAKASDGASIALTKRIPTEAGLGGGSTDAAATLWGLNRLWDLNLQTAEIVELAPSSGVMCRFSR
jgi:4-diphosphocytidyl-2-C-methyl-D-erythritol kinase